MITFQECIHPLLTHYCEEVYLVPLSCDLILLGASLLYLYNLLLYFVHE